MTKFYTCVEEPVNRSLSEDVLIVPDKVDLLPHIAEEPVHVALTQISGTVEPIGPENAHLKMQDPAFPIGVQGVDVGGAIVPFQVVLELPQLVLDDVEVSTIGPVVPQVHHLQGSAIVHEQNRVELVGPCRRSRVIGHGHHQRDAEGEEDEERQGDMCSCCRGHCLEEKR